MLDREESGVISAYIPGVPVYGRVPRRRGPSRQSAGRSPPTLKRIRDEVGGGREGHDVQRLTRVSTPKVTIVGPAALIGGQTSRRKAASSRANGRLGAGRVVRRRTAKR